MQLTASRLAVALTVLLVSAPAAAQAPPASNPFFDEWTTPFGMPPFDRIKAEHYKPAFEVGIADRKKEVEAIASNPAVPTFTNTVEALENGGLALAKVSDVFFTLTGAETNDALQAINKEIAPKLSALRDDVLLNEKLFARVKAVWETREKLALSVEQKKLLEETYKDFVRGGANLAPEQKKRFREINQELVGPGPEVRRQPPEGDERLQARDRDAGKTSPAFPRPSFAAAADAAKAAKLEGKWVVHAAGALDLSFPDVRRQPRPPEEDPRRPTRRAATTATRSTTRTLFPDGRTPRRAGPAPRLQDPRRLRPRGEHGEDAGRASTDLLNRLWTPALAVAKKEAVDSRPRSKPTERTSRSKPGTGGTTPRRSGRPASTSTTRRSAPTSRSTACARAPSTSRTGSTA